MRQLALFAILLLAPFSASAAGVTFNALGIRCTPHDQDGQIIELSMIGMNGNRYPGKGTGTFHLDNRYKTPDSYVFEFEDYDFEVFGKTGLGVMRIQGYDHHEVGRYDCVDFQMN